MWQTIRRMAASVEMGFVKSLGGAAQQRDAARRERIAARLKRGR